MILKKYSFLNVAVYCVNLINDQIFKIALY